jgi:hypothetical protein
MTFNLIPAGTFTMGSPEDEPGRFSDETQHQVTLTKPFYMSVTEVTQQQWQEVIGNIPATSNFSQVEIVYDQGYFLYVYLRYIRNKTCFFFLYYIFICCYSFFFLGKSQAFPLCFSSLQIHGREDPAMTLSIARW